jgi:hypothetical protein
MIPKYYLDSNVIKYQKYDKEKFTIYYLDKVK